MKKMMNYRACLILLVSIIFSNYSCKKKESDTPIEHNIYMRGTYDGAPFNMKNVVITNLSGVTWIQGVNDAGKSIVLLVNTSSMGTYNYGKITDAGNSEIRCDLSGKVFETHYKECAVPPAQSDIKYSSGRVKLVNVGEFMQGEFEATLYIVTDCTIETKKISGEFSAPKGN
jgi:hypothetical protein